MKTFTNKFHTWAFKTIYIDNAEAAATHANELVNTGRLLGLDLETGKTCDHVMSGLCPHLSRIRLCQIYDSARSTSYVFDLYKVNIEVLRDALRTNRFVAHNAIFELMHLTKAGFNDLNIGCSLLISQLVTGAEYSPFEPEPLMEEEDDEDKTGLSQYTRTTHTLDAVVQRLFEVKVDKAYQTSNWDIEELSDEQIIYAGLDALLTYKAASELAKKLSEHKLERIYGLLKDMQHVVVHMQLVGIPVDWEYHKELVKSWEIKRDEALKNCEPYFGTVNMRSGKQMGEWLVKYLQNDQSVLMLWPRTKKGAYAFARPAIAGFTHLPAIKVLLEYKKYAKLLDTYGESLVEKRHPVTSRLHTSYTLGETRTGRLSSRSPNIQNGPREVSFRNMFKAKDGWVLVVSDFSQIELRLQAEFSRDPRMVAAYKEKQDVYITMASAIYSKHKKDIDKSMRFVGKTVMLALGYGMGANKLAHYASAAGISQPALFWEKAHATYYSTFKSYIEWCDHVRAQATKNGYARTLYGKKRKLVEDEVYTRAPNTVIQGTAAELMMVALLKVYKKVRSYGEVVATVHDEILLHVPKEYAEQATKELSDSMNDAMKELFPTAASFHVADAAHGERWGDAKSEL